MSVDPDFEKLVNLYYRDLYRFGFSLTRSEADACDLTQQTFYIWANKGHQLKDLGKVKGWLFTTLHREFLQMSRRQERFTDEPISEVAENLPNVSADVVNRMDAQTMLEVLGQIDEAYRVPLGTVQSRIARGKMHLFQLLTEPITHPGKANEYHGS